MLTTHYFCLLLEIIHKDGENKRRNNSNMIFKAGKHMDMY